jgi:hypothetical protein
VLERRMKGFQTHSVSQIWVLGFLGRHLEDFRHELLTSFGTADEKLDSSGKEGELNLETIEKRSQTAIEYDQERWERADDRRWMGRIETASDSPLSAPPKT